MLTDDQKDAIRAKVTLGLADLAEKTAPWYLGRFCPEFAGECKGPYCQKFLPTDMRGEGKITGAACAVTLAASQIGPIAGGVQAGAQALVDSIPTNVGSKILTPAGH